jgi:transposase-like protein
MTDKNQGPVQQAHALATTTSMSLDLILNKLQVTHEEYRQHYPQTEITAGLALDILDARDIDGLTLAQIQRKWNLTNSQLHYALYNDNATRPKVDENALPRQRVLTSLKESNGRRSQTEIAAEHGVSQSFVHQVAKDYDLLPNNRKKRVVLTARQKETIIDAAVNNKVPVERLAKQYGVARDTIYKLIRGAQ